MSIVKQMLGDFIGRLGPVWISLVRTYVPVGLGATFGWLASQGIELPGALAANSESLLIGLGIAAWYALARVLEVQGATRGISWLVLIGGLMNGLPKPPDYNPTTALYEPYTAESGDPMVRVTTTGTNGTTEEHFIA